MNFENAFEGMLEEKENKEKFNTGVDACIAKLEKVKSLWVNAGFKNNPTRKWAIGHYDELIQSFEQLKKEIK